MADIEEAKNVMRTVLEKGENLEALGGPVEIKGASYDGDAGKYKFALAQEVLAFSVRIKEELIEDCQDGDNGACRNIVGRAQAALNAERTRVQRGRQ